MLSRREQYRLLDIMGIRYWLSTSPKTSILRSDHPVFCSTCLVVLSDNPAKLDAECTKILKGMLSVLELDKKEICLTWLSRSDIKAHELINELEKWAPQSVLMLGERFSKVALQGSLEYVQVTFDPTELKKRPHDKTKAYRDLLCLKEKILSCKMAQ